MFYDIFRDLCEQKGIKPGPAAEACGINRSNVTLWKQKGYTPRPDALNKIAAFFDVPIDYLLDNSDSRSGNFSNISDSTVIQGNSGSVKLENVSKGYPQPCQDSLTEQETELLRIFRHLSLRDKTTLMATAFDLEDKSTK
nr:MAG TPA: helix-turn-helix domain protein [Bacteriophage sp.]